MLNCTYALSEKRSISKYVEVGQLPDKTALCCSFGLFRWTCSNNYCNMFHPRRFQHFQLPLHFGREICHLFLGCCSFLDGLLSSPHWLQLDSLLTKRGFFPDNVSEPEFSIYFFHAMNVVSEKAIFHALWNTWVNTSQLI